MSEIRFAKCDVTVQEYEIGDCAKCYEPIRGQAFFINLDFRGVGTEVAFGEELYCSERCAEEVADRIRATLPDEPEV